MAPECKHEELIKQLVDDMKKLMKFCFLGNGKPSADTRFATQDQDIAIIKRQNKYIICGIGLMIAVNVATSIFDNTKKVNFSDCDSYTKLERAKK